MSLICMSYLLLPVSAQAPTVTPWPTPTLAPGRSYVGVTGADVIQAQQQATGTATVTPVSDDVIAAIATEVGLMRVDSYTSTVAMADFQRYTAATLTFSVLLLTVAVVALIVLVVRSY